MIGESYLDSLYIKSLAYYDENHGTIQIMSTKKLCAPPEGHPESIARKRKVGVTSANNTSLIYFCWLAGLDRDGKAIISNCLSARRRSEGPNNFFGHWP